jgi:coenzyme PQQ precursor peptide PqqA
VHPKRRGFMTWSKPQFELVDLGSEVTTGASRATWTKPEFEFVDLCCEVTLYLYHG